MEPLTWLILLFATGIVLLLAELLLPTHGILGLMGAGSIIASVCFAFAINQWAGLIVLLVMVAATPFVGAWVAKIWPRTYVGKRLVLPPIESKASLLPVQMGQMGVTVTELRPMGICEFSGQRVEASSEIGIIAPGTRVQVINVMDRRPIVRAIDNAA